MHGTERRAKVLNVVRVSSGNFLEMFDFMVFGYYASSIGHTFFSERECFCIADAGADDVRGRVFDATSRSRHSRRLY